MSRKHSKDRDEAEEWLTEALTNKPYGRLLAALSGKAFQGLKAKLHKQKLQGDIRQSIFNGATAYGNLDIYAVNAALHGQDFERVPASRHKAQIICEVIRNIESGNTAASELPVVYQHCASLSSNPSP